MSETRNVVIIGSGMLPGTPRRFTRRAGQLETPRRRRPRAGRPAFADHCSSKTFPAFRMRIHGSAAGRERWKQAERWRQISYGAHYQRRSQQAAVSIAFGRPSSAYTDDDYCQRGFGALAGITARAAAYWAWRFILRDLRRLLFLRERDRCGRRRIRRWRKLWLLTRFATKVTVIHRRDVFRASKIMLERAQHHEKIKFLPNTVVEDVYDIHHKEVTGLKLRHVKTGRVWDFPTSALFLGIGHEPNAKMFASQLDTDADPDISRLITTYSPACMGFTRAAMCRIGAIARPMPRRVPVAWPPSKWRNFWKNTASNSNLLKSSRLWEGL